MVFECQRDSYKSEFTTKVVSCKEYGPNQYEIILEDTILFPEGGGQVSLFVKPISAICEKLSWASPVSEGNSIVPPHEKILFTGANLTKKVNFICWQHYVVLC